LDVVGRTGRRLARADGRVRPIDDQPDKARGKPAVLGACGQADNGNWRRGVGKRFPRHARRCGGPRMTTPRKLHDIPIPRIPISKHPPLLTILVVAWKPYHFRPSRQYAESMARSCRKVLDCGGLSQISPSQYPSHRRNCPPQRAACGAPAVVATPLGGRRCISAVCSSQPTSRKPVGSAPKSLGRPMQ
jgi:hypothetical protein